MLDAKQINLTILICCAILFPLVGGDIRFFYDNKMYIHLGITIAFTGVLFYIIKKCINIITSKTAQNYINTGVHKSNEQK